MACDPSAGHPCAVALVAVQEEEGPPPADFVVTATEGDPSKSARSSKWVGLTNCSWTTEMMAMRVLNEGVPWTYVGRLVPARTPLESKVAAPYTVGPAGPNAIHVLANEVLENLERKGATRHRVELHGRLLEVQGIRYFVVT